MKKLAVTLTLAILGLVIGNQLNVSLNESSASHAIAQQQPPPPPPTVLPQPVQSPTGHCVIATGTCKPGPT